ncbi:MAG: class I SAM-dependent methyltransferase [Candidatus Thiodiazotropha sp. (ex Ctena orbiculata)]|nr:class I SAM-dependent methyltransferase [Candidatus Thiodiazotropha taylori]MBT3033750.1 class I SAM-dependent methyltransferase [Candidatus Thiodiazotropha taylori]
MPEQLFDNWPDKYRRWFETPIGRLVKEYELRLILRLLQPQPDELILDAGCGNGIFTQPMLDAGAQVVGVDLSAPMLSAARRELKGDRFAASVGNICALPFADHTFDKVVSITALEFIEDAQSAINELFRVSRTGGSVVVATLNSLSPWAERRIKEAEADPDSVFREIHFRSPAELSALAAPPARVKTAIHFPKSATQREAVRLEAEGEARNRDRGAFVIARWMV